MAVNKSVTISCSAVETYVTDLSSANRKSNVSAQQGFYTGDATPRIGRIGFLENDFAINQNDINTIYRVELTLKYSENATGLNRTKAIQFYRWNTSTNSLLYNTTVNAYGGNTETITATTSSNSALITDIQTTGGYNVLNNGLIRFIYTMYKNEKTLYGDKSYTENYLGVQQTGTQLKVYFKRWEVTYALNGGSGSFTTAEISNGTSYTISSTEPTRTGYSFLGWTDGTKTYQPGDPISSVTKDITLTAVWQSNITYYAVSFDPNGGSGAPDAIVIQSGGSITIPSDNTPTRGGHTFLGWSRSNTATVPSYFNGDTITNITSSFTLYAVWQSNATTTYYTITFNGNGGSGGPGSYSVSSGGSITIPSTEPVLSGYTFLGWSRSNVATTPSYYPGNTITNITSSFTLYAVWKSNSTTNYTYTINFNGNGNTGGSIPSSLSKEGPDASVVMGKDIGSEVPTKTGYTFRGWSANKDYNDKRIAYSSNHGGSADKNGTPATTTSSNWSYATYCDKTGGNSDNKTLTLYAQWEPISSTTNYIYTINFDGNGNTGGSIPSSLYGEGPDADSTQIKDIGSEVPTKTGYTYRGWSASSDYSNKRIVYSSSNGGGADRNGVSAVQTSSNGWSYATYCDKTGGDPNNKTLTLYAQWERDITTTYTITFYSDINNTVYGILTAYPETELYIPVGYPTQEGKICIGWSTEKNATVPQIKGNTFVTFNSDTEFYPVWRDSESYDIYTIIFDVNGGSASKPKDIIVIDENYDGINVKMGDIDGEVPSLAGYIFRGWSSTKTYNNNRIAYWSPVEYGGGEDKYGFSAKITSGNMTYKEYCDYTDGDINNKTLILYAQWEPSNNTYCFIKFDPNGGIGGPGIISQPIGEPYVVPSDAIPEINTNNYTETEINNYIISYNVNGGYPQPADGIGKILLITGDKYTFFSWNEKQDGSGPQAIYPGYIINSLEAGYYFYYAQYNYYNGINTVYSPIKIADLIYQDDKRGPGFTVSFDANGGVNPPNTLVPNANISYSFSNWNTDINGSGIAYNPNILYPDNTFRDNTTLYAIWDKEIDSDVIFIPSGEMLIRDREETPTGFTVTYKDNNTTIGTDRAKQITEYTFNNYWNTEANGSGTRYLAGHTSLKPSSDMILYAEWDSTNFDEPIYLLKPEKEGYDFLGWGTSRFSSTVRYKAGDPYTPTSNTSLYAKWQTAVYTIKYDLNGAIGTTPNDSSKTHGVSIRLQSTDGLMAKPSSQIEAYVITLKNSYDSLVETTITTKDTLTYTINGWNTASDGSGKTYASQATYTDEGNITLYINWDITTIKGTAILPTPVRKGYNFLGWYTEQGEKRESEYIPTNDETLYAHWEVANYITVVDRYISENAKEKCEVYYFDGKIWVPIQTMSLYLNALEKTKVGEQIPYIKEE